MIRCPVCGANTLVTETRHLRNASRRRRQCSKPECGARITTMEIPVGGQRLPHDGALSVVRTRDLEALRTAIAAMLPDPVIEEPATAATTGDPGP